MFRPKVRFDGIATVNHPRPRYCPHWSSIVLSRFVLKGAQEEKKIGCGEEVRRTVKPQIIGQQRITTTISNPSMVLSWILTHIRH